MKKHIMILAITAAAFAACEKPASYEPGAPMDLTGPNVYFSSENSNDLVLPSDETSFQIEVCREDATDALTVPLKAFCGTEDAFVFPESIEFPSGVDTVLVTVAFGEEFEMFKDYTLHLSIPEEYTHAYKQQEASPNFMMNLLQEDFVPYAKGMYLCSFCEYAAGWSAWEQVLEYSAITDTFRFSDLWTPGTFLTFQWDKADTVTVDEDSSFRIGLDAGYGMIYAHPLSGEYDAETQTLVINVDMVDSSSWGKVFPQIYQITEFLM